MYSSDDPKIIWVSSTYDGAGTGSYEMPFADINMALERAQPGNTIVLLPGTYTSSVNVQNSGTVDKPIKIVAQPDEKAEVCFRSGWFFYDASDIVVSGIVFRDIPHQALSAIGACKRNSFADLRFVNCGVGDDAPCTLFFGGSGAECNVVEHCMFTVDQTISRKDQGVPIGIMISEGDTEDGAVANMNHIFRRNTFVNYGCGIVVGTHEFQNGAYSHIVENNHIQNCSGDGIRVKCGDTIVRGNLIQECKGSGVSIVNGSSDIVADNRIEACGTGIHSAGMDCSIVNNCILRSKKQAVLVDTKSEEDLSVQGNTLIENNTIVDSGAGCEKRVCRDINLDTDSNCIIQRNLFSGKGKPLQAKKNEGTIFVDDNKVIGECLPAKGCSKGEIDFFNKETDNFATESTYGASGWMSEGKKMPESDENPETIYYRLKDYPHNLINKERTTVKEAYFNALYQPARDVEESDGSTAQNQEEDGIIDFSDWDV